MMATPITKRQIMANKALELVGCGYAWGSSGQKCTQALLDQLAAKYPAQTKLKTVCPKWNGKRVFDCATFVRETLQAAGISICSGASSQWKGDYWQEKGLIADMPRDKPCVLYNASKNADPMGHTGIYLGDGTTVDARGSVEGVVHEELDSRPWSHYAVPKGGDELIQIAKATSEKYTKTKKNCPFPDFEGDMMDKRSWGNMMTRVLRLAREHTRPGGVLVLFVDWRQYPTLSDVLQWSGWTWRGVAVWDKGGGCRPQRGRFKQQAEYIVWGSNGAMPLDRAVPCLPGVYTMRDMENHKSEKINYKSKKYVNVPKELVAVVVGRQEKVMVRAMGWVLEKRVTQLPP